MRRQISDQLAGSAVAAQRAAAIALGKGSSGEHDAASELERWRTSTVPERRAAAGYAMAWYARRNAAIASVLATTLVNDDDWTVREAATFGVRDALVRDYASAASIARRWAQDLATPREHRAFIVVARQPRTQQTSAVTELVRLLRTPLADGDGYVRKNVPFCLNYLARIQPHVLAGELTGWADEDDRWLSRSCLIAVANDELRRTSPMVVGAVIERLSRSRFADVSARVSQLGRQHLA